ncbi:MAG: cyclic nucleotide-binding domain-containing protein [Chloroflexota bacterium]
MANASTVTPTIVSRLRTLALFAYLSAPQLEAVATACQQVRFAPGDRLYHQGDSTRGLYILLSGTAEVLQTFPGGEREIGRLRAGDTVGEDSLFASQAHASSVLIAQDSTVIVLSGAAFDAVLTAYPDIRPVLNLRRDVMEALQAYSQRRVRPDEVVVLLTRRHPWAFAGHAVVGAIIAAVLVALAFAASWLPPQISAYVVLGLLALAFIIPALLAIYYFFEWRNDYFVVTNQRIIHEERYLLTGAEQRDQALLTSVQNVNVSRRGLIADLIGFGDVIVNVVGVQQPLILDTIPTPARVQQTIFAQIQRRKEQPPTQNEIRTEVDSLFAAPAESIGPMRSLSGLKNARRSTLGQFWAAIVPPSRVVEGDQITYHKHWLILLNKVWMPTFAFLLLIPVIIVLLSGRVPLLRQIPGTVILGVVFGWWLITAIWFYWRYATWREDIYIVDNQYVMDIMRTPLHLRETHLQASLAQIQSVTSRINNIWGRTFNIGNVIVQTAAEHGTMTFDDISNPSAVAEEILQRVQHHAEQRNAANQQDQRQLVAEYLAAYHQAVQRDTVLPPSPPPVQVISENPAAPHPNLDQTQARPLAANPLDTDESMPQGKPPSLPM